MAKIKSLQGHIQNTKVIFPEGEIEVKDGIAEVSDETAEMYIDDVNWVDADAFEEEEENAEPLTPEELEAAIEWVNTEATLKELKALAVKGGVKGFEPFATEAKKPALRKIIIKQLYTPKAK